MTDDIVVNDLELNSGNERQGPWWSDACCGCSGELTLTDLEQILDFVTVEINRLRATNA